MTWYVEVHGEQYVGPFPDWGEASWYKQHQKQMGFKVVEFEEQVPPAMKPYFWLELRDDVIGPFESSREAAVYGFRQSPKLDHRVTASPFRKMEARGHG